MPTYSAIVNIDMKYVFEAESRDDAFLKVQNVPLPKHYLTHSWKLKSLDITDDDYKSFYHLEEAANV